VLGSTSSKSTTFGVAATGDDENGEDDGKPAFEGLEEEKEDERFFKQDSTCQPQVKFPVNVLAPANHYYFM
jgi:hypothetical protein